MDHYSAVVSNFASGVVDKVDRLLSHPTAKLALTAAAASAVTLGSVLGSQAVNRRRRARRLKRDVLTAATISRDAPDVQKLFPTSTSGVSATTGGPATTAAPIRLAEDEEALVREQLSRNISFLGDDGVRKLRDSFVVVVGCGGVGSWAALMLLRSGVERVRVVDFDQVTLSSLNRHAVATRTDVGLPKVVALKNHMRETVPHAVIEARVDLFKLENARELLDGNPDYILDCIDNMKTKIELLKFCHDHNLPVISSMGAGAKVDPTRVQISDISETFEDPLARATRRNLKKLGVEKGITVVYSTEKPGPVGLVPLDESQKENPADFAALPTFRVRILPVLGTLPAIFGMSMASYVIVKLAQFPIDPLPVKLRDSLYARLHRDVRTREEKLYNNKDVALEARDVGYICDEIYRGRSVVSGATDRLAILRWDASKPLTLQNCVVMTKTEAEKHAALRSKPEDHYPAEVTALVEQRRKEEVESSKWR